MTFSRALVLSLALVSACTRKEGATKAALPEAPVVRTPAPTEAPPATGAAPAAAAAPDTAAAAQPAAAQNYDVRIAGTVRSQQEGTLAFRIAGTVKRTLVEVGDKVRKGQVLAELDTDDLVLRRQATQLAFERARVARDQAQRDLDRERNLSKEAASTPVRLEKINAALETAELGFREAETQLKIINKSIADASLTAEFPGVVVERMAKPGEFIGSGAAAFRISNTDNVEIRLDVPEHLYGTLKVGQELPLFLRSNDQTAKMRITRMVPVIDEKKRSFQVIGAPAGQTLVPGQFVEAVLTTKGDQ